jgi:hypothetical protein
MEPNVGIGEPIFEDDTDRRRLLEVVEQGT